MAYLVALYLGLGLGLGPLVSADWPMTMTEHKQVGL